MTTNKWGTNQHKVKWGLDYKTKARVFMCLCFALVVSYLGNQIVQERDFRKNLISPLPDSIATKPTKVYAVENDETQKEIDQYIKTIFGKDYKTAIAIQRAECNPKNKQYPYCRNISGIEHSIGVFQINIMRHHDGKHIHWDKIPGDNLEQKEHFLSDPLNNVLIAYKIYQDSGFEAWSAYTNGAYLQQL